MKKLTTLLVVAILLAPSLSYAASPWTEKATYSEKAGAKFAFGFKNTVMGWTELFYEPHVAKMDKTNVWKGIGKGIVNFGADTIGGALHLVTFPITQVDIPLPDNGVHFDK